MNMKILLICSICFSSHAFAETTFTRMKDEILKLDPDWQSCKKDSDCVVVNFSCEGSTAIRKDLENEITKKIYERGGNPTFVECATQRAAPLEALCTKNKCGSFHFETGSSPKCTLVESGYAIQLLALKVDQCKLKCQDHISRKKHLIRYQAECFYNSKSILKFP
jgi:hypothetical protein